MILFGQISGKDALEYKFDAKFSIKSNSFSPGYCIYENEQTTLITSQAPEEFSQFTYGLTPFWASKKITIFDAPVDGDVPTYPPKNKLHKRIIQMPAFRKPIREQRCLIPVDYFIVSENGEAYIFYTHSSKPFAIAGVYDHWKLTIRDEILTTGFCPLTVPQIYDYNLQIRRFPVILPPKYYKTWLKKDIPLNEVTNLIDFYNGNDLIGYPIESHLITKRINDERIIRPIGEPVFTKANDSKNILSYLKNIKRA